MGKSVEIMGEDFSTCQEGTGNFGENFGANFEENFGEIFGNCVSNSATSFGNFVQQKGSAKELWMPHLKYLFHCGKHECDNTSAITMLHQMSSRVVVQLLPLG